MFDDGTTKQQVDAIAASSLMNARTSENQIMEFATWLAGQTDAELTALGYSTQQITYLRGAFGDMSALYTVAHGGALPAGYTLPKDFTANVVQVIGPPTA
jgi:hypothetical protein